MRRRTMWLGHAARVGALAIALAPGAARAADLLTSYAVDDMALRGAVLGTPLTFELWKDSACTAAAGSPTVVAIETVTRVERLKLWAPRGAGRPPKTAKIVQALSGVTLQPSLYLTVTGTGAVPRGPACQLQFLGDGGGGGGIPCLSQVGDDVFFEGCNVHVRNGMSNTTLTNGLGNLVVGYNEAHVFPKPRSGSHNLVIGREHGYSSYSGIVTGTASEIGGRGNAVISGYDNATSDADAVVVGGFSNRATSDGATVVGGQSNEATDLSAVVLGGILNVASAYRSVVVGGEGNEARGAKSVVSGGKCNVAGPGPALACAGGGFDSYASVSGGFGNLAAGQFSSITGGDLNVTAAGSSVVSGGFGITQATPQGWSAGSVGASISGRFSSP